MLEQLTAWLGQLPLGTLYVAIIALSAFENFFPPFPSDGVVAFGSFLVARAKGSPLTVWLLGMIGNVGGAIVMYALSRKYGAETFKRRLEKFGGPTAEKKMHDLYARYGVFALFVSRFLPGVRAIVPPFAGAMKLPAGRVIFAIASASAVWFGFITFLAFRAGDNWELLQSYLVRSGKAAGIIAVAITALAVGVWLVRRRQPKSE